MTVLYIRAKGCVGMDVILGMDISAMARRTPMNDR